MIQILVNNVPLQILQPPPLEVYSLTIINTGFPPTLIDNAMTKPIQEWLYNITQSVIKDITYNGTIIPKDEVVKPSHLKV